jgi:hypothetical protein
LHSQVRSFLQAETIVSRLKPPNSNVFFMAYVYLSLQSFTCVVVAPDELTVVTVDF